MSLETVRELIKLMQENRVTSLKCGDIELQLDTTPLPPVPHAPAPTAPDTHLDEVDEETLFWSVDS